MSQERYALNKQLAQMLKGGVIMDVTTPEQAKIAEEAGACAVMALERIPADIRAAGGVSRMSDPKMIKGIQEAVSIPVMAMLYAAYRFLFTSYPIHHPAFLSLTAWKRTVIILLIFQMMTVLKFFSIQWSFPRFSN